MKLHNLIPALFAALAFASIVPALAQPTAVTYQGRLSDNGTNFSGTGQFKFALVTSTNNSHQATASANLTGQFVTSVTVLNGGNGYVTAPAVTFSGGGGSAATATAMISGGVVTNVAVNDAGSGYTNPPTVTLAPPPPNINYTTYWSNDGTSVGGSEPAAAVSIAVADGLFTVMLGDSTMPNMMSLDGSLFKQPNLQLRIWFNDGTSGSLALSPVQNLTAAPYAAFAALANGLPGVSVQQNTNGAPNVIGGSPVNFAAAGVTGATIAGGGATNGYYTNRVTGDFGTVGGGANNSSGGYGTVSGGAGNNSSYGASVGGGVYNSAGASYATIGGGSQNTAGGYGSTVGGGEGNIASAGDATIAGGYGNVVSNLYAAVGGGLYNIASGNGAVVSGGEDNVATNDYAAIGGGVHNRADGQYSVIGGGQANYAISFESVVSGGGFNSASGGEATVGGGNNNQASGGLSTIPGGYNNTASGYLSFAAGDLAQALHQGTFVWADSQGTSFASTGNNQFLIRAVGGVGIGTSSPATQLHVASANQTVAIIDGSNSGGTWLGLGNSTAGGARWSLISSGSGNGEGAGKLLFFTSASNSRKMMLDGSGNLSIIGTLSQGSDRNTKTAFEPIKACEILQEVAKLPMMKWAYTNEATVKHIGPMAQDFHAAFGLNGADDNHITTIDEGGVALAAIQGLNQKLEAKDAQIAALEKRLAELEKLVGHLATESLDTER